ncbi:hypothetical protein Aduo_011433 [Ancylostoma duodenale]
MRALTELRAVKIRPGQELADFCVALEKLGRMANPSASIQDRSLEYAQILISNLKQWPEHVQLLSAIHRVEPERAYEEVKQLAMSMEQSKTIWNTLWNGTGKVSGLENRSEAVWIKSLQSRG